MTEKLTYRLFEKGDIKGVLRLWEGESDWGGITEEQFNRWFDTPFGRCLISVAVNKSGDVLGQQAFMPAKFYINGAEKKACRVLAPILSREIRSNIRQKDHPFYEMHRVCLEAAISEEFSLIYGFPLHAWITVLNLFPKAGLPKMEIAEYECWSLAKEKFKNYSLLSGDLVAAPTTEISNDFNDLWKLAKQNFPIKCGMVRDAERLRWKLGGHLVFATRNAAGKLIGYTAINKRTGLIIDMLAVSPTELEAVLASSLKALNLFESEHGAFSFDDIGMMKTKTSFPLIENFNFRKADYKFAFGCYSIDPKVEAESILPANWYKMPDD